MIFAASYKRSNVASYMTSCPAWQGVREQICRDALCGNQSRLQARGQLQTPPQGELNGA